MGKTEEDWLNRIEIRVFENCSAQQFFKVDPCCLQLQK